MSRVNHQSLASGLVECPEWVLCGFSDVLCDVAPGGSLPPCGPLGEPRRRFEKEAGPGPGERHMTRNETNESGERASVVFRHGLRTGSEAAGR